MQDDLAGAVVPIDNLSMVVSIIFLYIIFKEKLSAKSGIRLHIIIADTYLCFYGLNLQICVILLDNHTKNKYNRQGKSPIFGDVSKWS